MRPARLRAEPRHSPDGLLEVDFLPTARRGPRPTGWPVNTMNSSESRNPGRAGGIPRTLASALATSRCGTALKCRGCLAFLGSAAVIASPAGLSARWPWAMAPTHHGPDPLP